MQNTIKSGAGSDLLTIDATSNAARVSLYDSRGNYNGKKVSYSASTEIKSVLLTGTDVFAAIYGSGTKTIEIQRIIICGTVATAAVYGDVCVRKTSTAIAGGTSTALTQVPKDSTSGAGTATNVKVYTVAPTPGTPVGVIDSRQIFLPITGTPAMDTGKVIFDWSNAPENEAPVLRGTGEGLELFFATTTTNAPTLTVVFEWTEK